MSNGAPVLSAVFLVAGSGLLLAAAIGLLRFPDLLTRLHAVLKAGTIGVLLIIAAFALVLPGLEILVRLGAAAAIMIIAAPAGAFMLADARGAEAATDAAPVRPPADRS